VGIRAEFAYLTPPPADGLSDFFSSVSRGAKLNERTKIWLWAIAYRPNTHSYVYLWPPTYLG
jgi:hypothetical protein